MGRAAEWLLAQEYVGREIRVSPKPTALVS
jgi:hypothetical protein